jgi:large subunit ribosomal protein L3
MKTLIGHKKEMTQIFGENGKILPVTIVDLSNVYVVDKKTIDKNGYNALVIGTGKKSKPNKPESNMFKSIDFVPQNVFEIRLSDNDNSNIEIGSILDINMLKLNDTVDVIGTSKGKGFQGVVKRWGFHGGPKTHGQSDRHRAPGSIGSGTTPGRVYKGKKMAGRMGGDKVTVKNLEVVLIDESNSLIGIRGAIPGNKGSLVIINGIDK